MALNKVTLAPNISIRWNPVNDNGQVRLDFLDFVVDDQGNPTSYTDPSKVDIHFDEISTLATRIAHTGGINDPVTGHKLPNTISGAAIMFSIKRLVDTIITERRREKIEQGIQPTLTRDGHTATIDLSTSMYVEGDSFTEMTVDWGDGNTSSNMIEQTASHTYANPAEETAYTISLSVNTSKAHNIQKTVSTLVTPV